MNSFLFLGENFVFLREIAYHPVKPVIQSNWFYISIKYMHAYSILKMTIFC